MLLHISFIAIVQIVASDEIFCGPDQVLEQRTPRCVNRTKEMTEVFSKCCPVGYSYDLVNHGCVPVGGHHFEDKKYLSIGLSTCYPGVVVDRQIRFNTLSSGLLDVSANDDYCIDKVNDNSEDTFVLRICKKDIWKECVGKERKCIRKCCPDLHAYKKGGCKPNFQRSVNYTNVRGNIDDKLVEGKKYEILILVSSALI